MFGKPVIAETRIPVEVILDKLAAGTEIEDIMRDYTRLTKNDIHVAVQYANNLVKKVPPHHAKASL